jgi:phospholipid/cholesterol/gamma-HCH transport system ATP-binding protein
VNLGIEHGEILVIIGRSGSGKSVLMRHFIGLLRPDSGEVFVEDQKISDLPEHKVDGIRLKFGMLFQDAALFDSMNVFENVAFALREHTKMKKSEIQQRVHDCLNQVGLHDIDDQFPETLSGGMRKRVGLARAIAMKPSIILYDEPTSGLDRITGQGINQLILELNKALHVTSVVVTHDIESARSIATRIALLDKGVIAALGTPQELMASNDEVVQAFLAETPRTT